MRTGNRTQPFERYCFQEGRGRAAAPPSPVVAVPNVTAHPSTASVPMTLLLYDGPLLCGFHVAIKGSSSRHRAGALRNCAVLVFTYANYAN